jgi:predicted XRE-type DNA-binding protein
MGMKGVPEWRAAAKRALAAIISDGVKQQGLTQSNAATALGIPQPKVSALMNSRLDGFSLERLIELLGKFGRTVTIEVGGGRSTSTSNWVIVRETDNER